MPAGPEPASGGRRAAPRRVVAGVGAVVGARIAQLVFVDAFLPEDGKAVQDYAPLPPTRADGWRVPPPATAEQFGVTDERDAAWVATRLGDQPLKTFTQRVETSGRGATSRMPAFIHCSDAPWFAEAATRGRGQGFQYRDLRSAGHDAMLSQPDGLATTLLGVT